MAIRRENSHIRYDPTTATGTCQGSLRLRGSAEYAPLLQLLKQAAEAQPAMLTLDIRALQFLNSSGIYTLSRFVFQLRKHNVSQIVIKGSRQFPWQEKPLRNFQRLVPGLQLEIE